MEKAIIERRIAAKYSRTKLYPANYKDINRQAAQKCKYAGPSSGVKAATEEQPFLFIYLPFVILIFLESKLPIIFFFLASLKRNTLTIYVPLPSFFLTGDTLYVLSGVETLK